MDVKIGERLMELRKNKGLSQQELAAYLGVSRQAVSKWERAEGYPDLDNLKALATLYGLTLDQTLNGNNLPPQTSPLPHCAKCNEQVDPDDTYCPNCGKRLKKRKPALGRRRRSALSDKTRKGLTISGIVAVLLAIVIVLSTVLPAALNSPFRQQYVKRFGVGSDFYVLMYKLGVPTNRQGSYAYWYSGAGDKAYRQLADLKYQAELTKEESDQQKYNDYAARFAKAGYKYIYASKETYSDAIRAIAFDRGGNKPKTISSITFDRNTLPSQGKLTNVRLVYEINYTDGSWASARITELSGINYALLGQEQIATFETHFGTATYPFVVQEPNVCAYTVRTSLKNCVSGGGEYPVGEQIILYALKPASFIGWFDEEGNLLTEDNTLTVVATDHTVRYYARYQD